MPLNALNYANLFAYVLNVLITYGSQLGWFGPTNSELSNKYQTVITPAGWAFSIWGLIFISEAVFVVVQMLPRYRATDAVQRGVGYWWCMACIAQCLWTPLFAQEVMWAQLIAMLTILSSLFMLRYSFDGVVSGRWGPCDEESQTASSFWLFCAPFSLHLGWICAASFVSLNVTILKACAGDAAAVSSPSNECERTMLTMAILTLVFFGFVAMTASTLPILSQSTSCRANAFVTGVAAWALGAISSELQDPPQSVASAFAGSYGAIGDAALAMSVICTILCAGVVFARGWKMVTGRALAGVERRALSQSHTTEHNRAKIDSSLRFGV